jgi:hypothetical protein
MATAVVTLDPGFDLAQGGECTCRHCRQAFATAYKAAMANIDPDAEVIITTYQSAHEADRLRGLEEEVEAGQKADLWQLAHGAVGWHPKHIAHLDADGDIDAIRPYHTGDGPVPDGWEILNLAYWTEDDLDTVADGTGIYTHRNEAGELLPGKE